MGNKIRKNPKVFHVLTHSIEPYALTPELFSEYDAYSNIYCREITKSGYSPVLGFLSLSVKKRTFLTHKYGHKMIAYPVTVNRGRFGFEISKELIEDVIRCDADIIHVHSYYLFMYDLIALANKLTGTPLIAHYHGGSPQMLLCPNRILKKATLRLADNIIAVNRTEIQRLREYWKLPTDVLTHIPNGVDTNTFVPLDYPSKDDNLLLFVGNLVSGKGLVLLLNAFINCKKKCKALKLLIVGDGDLKPKLLEIIHQQKMSDCIKISERVSHEELNNIYNRAAVTILPSKKEGFPLVLVESMACATPVIATINDGSKDIISHGIDGFLVPQNNVDALEKAIIKLVTNEDLRKKMGYNARKKVVSYFSWKIVRESLNAVYKSIT